LVASALEREAARGLVAAAVSVSGEEPSAGVCKAKVGLELRDTADACKVSKGSILD
jgi:hypothetical protein